MNGFRSLHLRLRLRRANQLQAIAQYDSVRTARKTHVAELHRLAVRDYVEKRRGNDADLNSYLESLDMGTTDIEVAALQARIIASD